MKRFQRLIRSNVINLSIFFADAILDLSLRMYTMEALSIQEGKTRDERKRNQGAKGSSGWENGPLTWLACSTSD